MVVHFEKSGLNGDLYKMTLRQLQYFIVLAEELNFTRAAERLNISQPPLSTQISQLEEELEVELFERTSRKVALTDAGSVFLHDVEILQRDLKEIVERVRHAHAGLSGRIEVGLASSHFLGPLPQAIKEFSLAYPHIEVVLNEMTPNAQIDALHQRKIDVSISRQRFNNAFLQSHLLWEDPIFVALPAVHSLAKKKSIKLSALSQESFIVLRRETSPFAERVFTTLTTQDFEAKIVHRVTEVPSQLSLVKSGQGVALAPSTTATFYSKNIVYVRLEEVTLNADVYAICNNNNNKRAKIIFLDFIKKYSLTPG